MTTAMMTGHCSFPATERATKTGVVPVPPEHSHETCRDLGAGATSPTAGFMPCPCACHLRETYECECGGTIREAPHWPNDYARGVKDADPNELVYVHVDHSGRAIREECA